MFTVAACDSFVWFGNTYYNSGTYLRSYTNSNGCNSIDTLRLTIGVSTRSASTLIACNNYTWRGTVYTSSGVYVYSYSNASGCPSTDTLYLTINRSSNTATSASTCDDYVWNGNTYSQSGTYLYSYTNGSGCLSTDTLRLSVGCSYAYPLPVNIDAGFERQTLGSLPSGSPNTSATQWSFVLSGNGQVRTINSTGGYGGPQYLSLGKLNPTTNTSTTAN